MPTWKKVTEQDQLDMFELFDNGMSTKEVVELTGWKQNTVYAWRKKWKKQRNKSNDAAAVEEAAPTEEKPTEEVLSDYAKSYLKGEAYMSRSSFDIERVVRIKSRKTGILYEVDGCDQKILKISLPDGTTLKIDIELFDRFVDEGIDVLLELKKTA